MKRLRIVALLTCLLLPSCYEFDFPLDPLPQVSVDARLLGTWRCLGVEAGLDDAPLVMQVDRKSDQVTHWRARSESADDKDFGDYDVHASTIKGVGLLNALEVKGDGSGKWSFVRYSLLLPDVLRLQLVDEDSFEKVKASATTLRREVERRKSDPQIYKDFCVCVRVKPKHG
jgi:hypothetical protein